MSTKLALVCGGTSGIGRGIAVELARTKEVTVIISGRNQVVGEEIVAEMKQLSPECNHEFVQLDAFMMKNIKEFCKTNFIDKKRSLNYLVMTQGMATIANRSETTEGIDKKLALHYYGRMQMINSLIPVLDDNGEDKDVRVLSVLSAGIHSAYINDDIELKNNFSIANAANAGGFYNDIGLDKLSRQHKNISFIHAAPGFVNSNWGTEMPTLIRCKYIILYF
jgi:NAD(P)-dependent dehydrogenase (short-subunit alcohol dehydrogenase family)